MRRLILIFTLALCAAAGAASADFAPLEKLTLKSGELLAPSPLGKKLDCAGAIALEMNSTVTGSTVGQPDLVSSYLCGRWPLTGGEMLYSLTLAVPRMFEIRLQASCDLDVVLLDACDTETGCVLVADTGIQTTAPVLGTYYIVVDGYEGAACEFTLEVAATDPRTIDPAACAAAMDLSCAQGTPLSGSNCGADDQIHALGCEDWPAAGGDRWYRLTVAPGGSFQIDLTMPDADAVLWLLGSCGEDPACLDYSDGGIGGEGESVGYTNVEAQNRTVYLVVDSYGTASCSSFDALLDCTGVIVSTETTSWSAFKARYAREEK